LEGKRKKEKALMHEFPHRYAVSAASTSDVEVALDSPGLPRLVTASPAEFDGPGTYWSPETMLVAAVASCFILTFRAVAKHSNFAWRSLSCEVEGTLDRVERVTQFTAITVKASLGVPAGTDEALARRLLEKSERACLITSSLKAQAHLEATVVSDH
jgi:peroxiredoxin-like protein